MDKNNQHFLHSPVARKSEVKSGFLNILLSPVKDFIA